MSSADHSAREVLGALLRDVSRSFYTTLRVLPAAVRPQIGIAYLLARATDTIADTAVVPVAERLEALNRLRDRLSGRRPERLDFAAFTRNDGAAPPTGSSAGERRLLERIEDVMSVLARFDDADRQRIRTVLATIASGQELDLQRFAPNRHPDNAQPRLQPVRALDTEADLDDYTYRVAGCVGEFWTAICRARVFPRARLDDAQLGANGIRLGKGLQLVNILRDLPADLRQGRCYLPLESLAPTGLTPPDLLQPANENRFRPAYNRWLDRAQAHLQAGWVYTISLPWRCARIRLACAWPILIGAKTLRALRSQPVLEPGRRVKISRRAVRNILLRTMALYPFPPAWRRLPQADWTAP